MKRNKRDLALAEAREVVVESILKVAKDYDLTIGEIFMILSQELQD